MDDNIFRDNVREVVNYFISNEFELAIFKANEIKEQFLTNDEMEFIDSLVSVIRATSIINSNGDLKEAYKLLLDSYNKLKSFRPLYKGLKLEGFINSIQESIAEIKNYI